MKIHHLNCGTMCPFGGSLIGTPRIVDHCLLIESGERLILLDTGFGTGDVTNPARVGRPFKALIGPRLDAAETAIEQVRGLGFDPADVRDILVTHLDVDHAGGLGDFPGAEVHIFAAEHVAAENPTLRERERYRSVQWAHGPRWVDYTVDGDDWFGFESVRVLPGSDDEIAMIPLPGHSRGHSAFAIRRSDGWLLHCGDGYFHRDEIATPPSCPRMLRAFESMMATDNGARLRNIERLGELARNHGDEVKLICSHDPTELERCQAAAG